jgi:hypothetical protein
VFTVKWDVQILKHALVVGAAGICDNTTQCLLDVTTGGDCAAQQPRDLHVATGDIPDLQTFAQLHRLYNFKQKDNYE